MTATRAPRGSCRSCGKTFTRSGIARHLAACPARPGGERVAFDVMAESGPYWLAIEIAAEATLADLDRLLRSTWLECCDHLSEFRVGDHTFSSDQGGDEGPPDVGLDVSVARVLRRGKKVDYDYDAGSTTNVVLRVIDSRHVASAREPARILARNQPPKVRCDECVDASADFVCAECGGTACRECVTTHECGIEFVLPVVNSPRSGVCGYVGALDDETPAVELPGLGDDAIGGALDDRPEGRQEWPGTDLSSHDYDQLAGMLRDGGGLDIEEVNGMFHALAVAPGLVPPGEWVGYVAPQPEDERSARRLLELLMRYYNATLQAVQRELYAIPPPEDQQACVGFARGYVLGASLDPEWIGDGPRWTFASPIAYLAERFDLVPDATRETIDKMPDPNAEHRRVLGALVHAANESFRNIRRQLAEAAAARAGQPVARARPPVPRATPNVGRNDPCICGSGKKYKKCCLGRELPS